MGVKTKARTFVSGSGESTENHMSDAFFKSLKADTETAEVESAKRVAKMVAEVEQAEDFLDGEDVFVEGFAKSDEAEPVWGLDADGNLVNLATDDEAPAPARAYADPHHFDTDPEDYIPNGKMDGDEMAYRDSHRRPEFSDFLSKQVSHAFDYSIDYYDWSFDEATFPIIIDSSKVDLLTERAEEAGFTTEVGDEDFDSDGGSRTKMWVYDPEMLKLMPDGYNPYTVRSSRTAAVPVDIIQLTTDENSFHDGEENLVDITQLLAEKPVKKFKDTPIDTFTAQANGGRFNDRELPILKNWDKDTKAFYKQWGEFVVVGTDFDTDLAYGDFPEWLDAYETEADNLLDTTGDYEMLDDVDLEAVAFHLWRIARDGVK